MPSSKKQQPKASSQQQKASSSPFFQPSSTPIVTISTSTPGGTKKSVKVKQPVTEHKSSLVGTSANLINAIVGSGIVGIPYAMQQSGLVCGILLVIFVALLTEKSLRLLIETAKHIDAPSYETLVEASFGRPGFFFVSLSMFVMAYGAMVSYLMIVKDTLPVLLGITDLPRKRGILFLVSICIMVPLSSQRDMADLAKTSRLSVLFDFIMVLLVAYTSPWIERLSGDGALVDMLQHSTIHLDTVFVGVGVLSFAFVCQHSAFIIAGSLERPTKVRWATSTKTALSFCVVLASLCGFSGYAGYEEDTSGNILNNLPSNAFSANMARALLGITMLFVYPMESFVARHVCVVLFFKGRRAHEGEDAAVLNRRDRRITLTMALYVMALIPAMLFQDLGTVLAATGCVGGSCLSYIGPGVAYLGVHGAAFLDIVKERFGSSYWTSGKRKPALAHPVKGTPLPKANLAAVDGKGVTMDEELGENKRKDACYVACFKTFLWYLLCMPLWCSVATVGARFLEVHLAEMQLQSPHALRIGNVHHKNGSNAATLTSRRQRDSNDDDDTEEDQPLITRQESLHLIGQRNVLPPVRSYQKALTDPLDAEGQQGEDIEDRFSRKRPATVDKTQANTEKVAGDEEDPQADPPQIVDFCIAVGYILFGVVAISAGLVSILST